MNFEWEKSVIALGNIDNIEMEINTFSLIERLI